MDIQNVHILLVDDNKSFINVMKFYLMDFIRLPQYKIDVAHNGHEALMKTRKKFYNVIFMDIDMPVMDGIEATRLIKMNCPKSQIIALSLYNSSHYREAMLAAGADDYFLKDSFDGEDLIKFF